MESLTSPPKRIKVDYNVCIICQERNSRLKEVVPKEKTKFDKLLDYVNKELTWRFQVCRNIEYTRVQNV